MHQIVRSTWCLERFMQLFSFWTGSNVAFLISRNSWIVNRPASLNQFKHNQSKLMANIWHMHLRDMCTCNYVSWSRVHHMCTCTCTLATTKRFPRWGEWVHFQQTTRPTLAKRPARRWDHAPEVDGSAPARARDLTGFMFITLVWARY